MHSSQRDVDACLSHAGVGSSRQPHGCDRCADRSRSPRSDADGRRRRRQVGPHPISGARRRIARPAEASALECRLESGRTHQIRVHLAAIGHPVVGDGTYGGIRHGIATPRPFLHAAELAFDHPTTRRIAVVHLAAARRPRRGRGSAHNVARPSSRRASGHGPTPRAASATDCSVKPSRSRFICSPADFQIASSTHWPSWSHEPSW